MKIEEILDHSSEITRRTLCNRVVMTSIGL